MFGGVAPAASGCFSPSGCSRALTRRGALGATARASPCAQGRGRGPGRSTSRRRPRRAATRRHAAQRGQEALASLCDPGPYVRRATAAPLGTLCLVERVEVADAGLRRPRFSVERADDIVEPEDLPGRDVGDVIDGRPVGSAGGRGRHGGLPLVGTQAVEERRKSPPEDGLVGEEVTLGGRPAGGRVQLLEGRRPQVKLRETVATLASGLPGRCRPSPPRADGPAPRCADRRPRPPPRAPSASVPTPARGGPPRRCHRAT